MTVQQLLSVANSWEFVSVEDDDYNVFAEGEAQHVAKSDAIKGLTVVCFYTGNRNNVHCPVIIAERKSKKERS